MINKLFKDRHDSAKQLINILPIDNMLQEEWIVTSSSSGGIDIAVEVAKVLNATATDVIITETVRILKEKFKWPVHNIDKFIRRLSAISENTRPFIRLSIVKEKESDNRILECAVSGDANLIVTGDKHLLRLKKYKNIPIDRPKYLTYLVKEE